MSLFPTSYSPDVQKSIDSALRLLDLYLIYFNFRRGDRQTTTLEFPLLQPGFDGAAIQAPLTREAYGDTEMKGIQRLVDAGWGYSLWTNRRVVSAGKDRVVLVSSI